METIKHANLENWAYAIDEESGEKYIVDYTSKLYTDQWGINPIAVVYNEVDAKLIAAAPNLLKELQFIVNVAAGKRDIKTKTIELRFEKDTLLTWLKNAEETIKKATE